MTYLLPVLTCVIIKYLPGILWKVLREEEKKHKKVNWNLTWSGGGEGGLTNRE